MFKKLLVPLDRSSFAEQALGPAAAIARASHAAMDVVLVHQPLPFAGFSDEPWNAELIADENKYLESTVAELGTGAAVSTTHAVLHGEATEMICARAKDVGADLVVMTSHGRTGLSRAWLGSVADAVLRQSAIPVLLLRPTEHAVSREAGRHVFKHVLVPFDGSERATGVVAPAVSLARCGVGRMTLLRVVQPIPLVVTDVDMGLAYSEMIPDDVATAAVVAEVTTQTADVAKRLTESEGLEVESHVVTDGRIARAILDFARGHAVDAVALSTHGRGASRLLVGSIADKILRGSELPVLLYRPVSVTESSQPTR